ncbi:hypothetical protein Tco_1086134 [Tanacetum coccineum]
MDGCTNGPQLEEGEKLNTRALGTGRTPPGGTSAPAGQAQGGTSPAFVKENIDVLRTMIKELDNRGQEKVTPHKLFNEESSGAGSENSQTSPSTEEVGGYSSDGSFRSRSRGRHRSARKNQKSVSKKKGISKSHRYHRRAKLPPNVRVYEGNKDPEDYLSIFSAAAEQEDLDPKSVDGFEELSSKFLEEFSQQKMYDKDHFVNPIHPELSKKLNDKIPKTVDEMWERVRAFIRGEAAADTTEAIRSPRWEKSAGKASWSEHQNRSRNRSHRGGEGRNIGTCAPYARREGFTPLMKTPKEILAMDNVNFPPPPPMVGILEKRNMNKFCDYHQDRGHNTNDCYHLKKQIEEAVASGRLAHLVKDIRQGGQKGKGSAKGREKVINMVSASISIDELPRGSGGRD